MHAAHAVRFSIRTELRWGVAREDPCTLTPDFIESRYEHKCQQGQRSNIPPIAYG